MVNFNGAIYTESSLFLNHENRGLRYGDALFETIRAVSGRLIFWEDHYLRLMAAMRMLRMEIPMDFTMEFIEKQILDTLSASALDNVPVRIRLTVFRNNGGLYKPLGNDVSYIVEAQELASPSYKLDGKPFEVELFKDFFVHTDLLATLKTNNKIANVVGSIFADENGYQSCLLLNTAKQVVEALNGNLFLVQGDHIKTPPLNDGALNGILRKKLLELMHKSGKYVVEEASISPFELQKANELFITNVIMGIQPITKYRKKEFKSAIAQELTEALNLAAGLY